jgi:hypothetical protein
VGGLGILLAAALTAWPVAGIARALGCEPLAAARLGVLWAALPGPALMAPMIDQAIALPVAVAAALMAAAFREPRSLGLAVLGGLAGGLACFLTYGAPAFLVIAGLGAAGFAFAHGGAVSSIARGLAAAATATVAVFFAPALLGHRPLASALAALAIHRDVYTRPRSYAVWLIFDLVDLAVFVGAPIAAVLAVRVSQAWSDRGNPTSAYALGAALGLGLLLVSGSTRGEVGRLWIPLMPMLLAAALAEGDDTPTAAEAALLTALCAGLALLIRVFWAVP